jgi:hypothetical protein
MIQVTSKPITSGFTPLMGRSENRVETPDLLLVAKRMFNEGFKKSTILRITGITEEDFVQVIRNLSCQRPSLV